MVPTLLISCAQRHEARAQTIPQLEAVGLDVTVFLDACDPVGKGGNGPIGLRAIRHARTLGGPVLVVEDDIDLAPDFPYFLESALESEALVYFYLNDRKERMRLNYGRAVADSIMAGEPQARRLLKAPSLQYLFGTQCVLIPEKLLWAVEAQLVAHGDAFDGNVVRAAKATAWPCMIAVPHPVQHRHDRTARVEDHRVKRSLSFDLPRLEAS